MARRWGDHPVVRRWYVLALGLVLTTAALVAVYRDGGVHWARAEVTLVTGEGAEHGADASLIPLTTILERALDDDMPYPFVSDDAPLYAVAEEGVSIRQVDTGGQWVQNHSAPTLVIEVVDADAGRVEELLTGTIGAVDAAVADLQAGVEPRQRAVVVVDEVLRNHIATSRSGLARALLMTGGIGLVVSVALCHGVDARRRPVVPARAPRALEPVS